MGENKMPEPLACRLDDFTIGLIEEKIKSKQREVFLWLASKATDDVTFSMLDERDPALTTNGIIYYLTPDDIEELVNL